MAGKTCYVESLGCAKNQVESEVMMAALSAAGFAIAPGPGGADIIVVNSCGFIEDAKRESINAVLTFRKDYPAAVIVLSGCLAIRYEPELRESLTEADAFYSSLNSAGFGEWLKETARLRPAAGTPPDAAPAAALGARPLLSLPGSAYVKISDGCNNRCSFCAIPLIRGGLRSRAIDGIAAECAGLLERGVKELCFVAQDLAAYGMDLPDGGGKSLLARLLARVSALKGDFWARLLYLHPDHFPFDILPVMQNDPRILPYFDIPFQHAAPGVLAAMNRRGGEEAYLRLLGEIRAALPDAVFRTTLLTGFPGETDADFQTLLRFQREAAFDWLGVFAYSEEEGTAACRLEGKIPPKIARLRKETLEKKQTPITEKKLARYARAARRGGASVKALVEEKIEDGLYLGRLAIHAPEVDGAVIIRQEAFAPGAFVTGKITGLSGFDLRMNCP